ncbi:MAG: DNA mismatch repair protein MutS [Chlamydiales bacterium]
MSKGVEEPPKLSPMMEQWRQCKSKAKEAILLFRMGDFYEAFYEDAVTLAQALDLTLTKRQGVPMSGVPWHTCDAYIDRLVRKGHRVAVAEQLQDPKEVKGLVPREIVRFVTPGTVVNSTLVGEKNNNFISALNRVGSIIALASLDLTTGIFQVAEMEDEQEVLNEIDRIRPSELLSSKKFFEKHPSFVEEIKAGFSLLLSMQESWHFDHNVAYAYLTEHFKVQHLDGFGLKGLIPSINAAGALLAYIHEELSLPIDYIQTIKPYSTQEVLSIDRVTQRHLELTESLQDGSRSHTLLDVIDQTLTPMGGRLIADWLKKPLLSIKEIKRRQDAVELLYYAPQDRAQLRKQLSKVRDLQRLMMKVSTHWATPRDLAALSLSLEAISPIKKLIGSMKSEWIGECAEQLTDLSELTSIVRRGIVDEPPVRSSEGNIFRDEFHPPLDELRQLRRGGKQWLAQYQKEVREKTGIKNLKVSFNKIFGYYIEVSKGQVDRMPETFQRKQTLVNSERFISPQLKEYESQILTAEERIYALEEELFRKLCKKFIQFEQVIFKMADAIARIDVIASLAEIAKQSHYCRPLIDESKQIKIIEGRHPVVSNSSLSQSFIPNDTDLDGIDERMMLITGPNMGGKSTYLRQVALIVVLAQIGSFVPAVQVHIGIVDKIFTRIGASDNLARQQSTFMVEMSETANILNNVTPRSLVILDEIGRGTSTYDGVSIAWAVAEHLLTVGAKTLFATHYWELTNLELSISGVLNYHTTVQEFNHEIIFLHKIEKGKGDRSYGIHVAQLAGLPLSVIARAQVILKGLEANKESAPKVKIKKESEEKQLMLF